MRLKIIAVGHKLPSWIQEGVDNYVSRSRSFDGIEIIEIPPAKRNKNSLVERIKQEEAQSIERKLKQTDRVIVLDEKGTGFSTNQLARKISQWKMEGRDVCFIIGGADGLDESFLGCHQEKASLSKLTLPHPMVRVLLAEQLYRAMTINANHPYHRQ